MKEPTCPYKIEDCSEDDFENMCDECLRDHGESHEELMRDTYD